MANNVYTIDHVTLEALDSFENNLRALKHCSRKVEAQFGNKGAQKGDSIRIRKPAEFTVRSGTAWAGQDIDEQFDTLTLTHQKGIDWSMTSRERKLDFNNIVNQVVRPAMIRLANEVDADILREVTRATWWAVGTPGTSPTAYSTYRDAGVLLSNMTCPRGRGQRFMHINAEMEGDLVNAGEGFFHRGGKISAQYDSAELDGEEYIAGFNWSMDQNVYTHTVGTYSGTIRVNGASQSGTALDLDGFSGSDNLNIGDRFTIADVFSVNPVTKATLNDLQQFVVTADISDTAGGVMDNVAIRPEIIGPGSVHQNVSALPADNAVVTIFGTTGNVYSQGIAWNKEAVTVAIVPLDVPQDNHQAMMKYDEDSGVGIRYIEWYDGDVDLWKCRTDVVYGILLQRGEHSVAIAGA